MTCVVALKRKDHFILMSDSLSTGVDYKETVLTEYLSKNNRYFEDHSCLIGHTGTCSLNQTVNSIPNLFNNFNEKYQEFDIEYVRHVLKPMIKEKLAEYNVITNVEAQNTQVNLFLAKDDKCFELRSDGYIREVDDISVFGSGKDAFLGSMLNCNQNQDMFIRCLKGLKAACKYDSGCGFPLIITSTKEDKRLLITEEDAEALINGEKELDL